MDLTADPASRRAPLRRTAVRTLPTRPLTAPAATTRETTPAAPRRPSSTTRPPTLTNLGTDWDDGTATLSWTASADTKEIDVDRAPGKDGAPTTTVFKGVASSFEDTGLQNKVKYVYTITGLDEVGNKAVDTISIVPGAKLYSPARGGSVTSPPLLAWRPYPGASYYNVQLYFGVGNAVRRVGSVTVSGRRVLSAWRLKKTWKWNKRKRALARGHYRWYVYPGLGKRSANKYGPLIGSSDFFVKTR